MHLVSQYYIYEDLNLKFLIQDKDLDILMGYVLGLHYLLTEWPGFWDICSIFWPPNYKMCSAAPLQFHADLTKRQKYEAMNLFCSVLLLGCGII